MSTGRIRSLNGTKIDSCRLATEETQKEEVEVSSITAFVAKELTGLFSCGIADIFSLVCHLDGHLVLIIESDFSPCSTDPRPASEHVIA